MKRILIIEDEFQTRRNLATILHMEGYEPLLAADGKEGVTVARRERPALILCDVMMPVMDGHDVITALRADSRTAHIPFIFLTARGERLDVRQGMNLGADDYITKPVTATELLAAVAARLERVQHRPPGEFRPDFSSAVPLESLGLTPREAEVLLWIAQGKTNCEISTILGTSDNTVKKHTQHIFEKLGLDTRHAATALAFEKLARGAA